MAMTNVSFVSMYVWAIQEKVLPIPPASKESRHDEQVKWWDFIFFPGCFVVN